MPIIMVHTLKSNDIEMKRELVKGITDAVEKATKFPRESITVIIKEDAPENIGKGGILPLVDQV
jgi:4-oxalocrotonate tautomerase family enzyme